MSRRIKNQEKPLIANYYYNLVANPKDYENITGDKMYAAVYAYFSEDFAVMNKLLTVAEFNKLKLVAERIVEAGFYVAELNELTFKESLFFEDVKVKAGKKHYYLAEAALNHLLNYNLSETDYEYDYYFHMVCGMIETYGLISFDEVTTIYQEAREEKYRKLIKTPITSDYCLWAMLMDRGYDVEDEYLVHDLVIGNYNYNVADIAVIYVDNFYYEIGYYGFLLAYMKALNISDNKDLKNMAHTYNFVLNRAEGPEDFFRSKQALLEARDNLELMVYLRWPIWEFGGHSLQSQHPKEQKATLEPEVARAFEQFITTLLTFINKKYKYVKASDSYNVDDTFTILTKAMKNRRVFREFGRSSKMAKTKLNKEFLKAFDIATYIEQGLAFNYEDDYLLVLEGKVVYHIAGINHAIEEVLSRDLMPIRVSLIVLPIKNRITYAFSILKKAPTDFSDDIIDIFNTSIAKAKHLFNAKDYIAYKSNKS